MEMGDLISRKALIERYGEPCHSFLDVIETMPAVDAEPVRHGTWEMCRKTIKMDFATLTGTYPTCSLCGHAEFGMDKSTPYCPNCGARMDEEDMKDGKTD